jgi:hypothetical protein
MCPPRWSLAISVVWLFFLILVSFWGTLAGSPYFTNLWGWETGISVVAIILLDRVLALNRWAFFAVAILAVAVGCISLANMFGGNYRTTAMCHAVGAIAAIRCFFSPRVTQDESPLLGKFGARTAWAAFAISAALGGVAFARSFAGDCPTHDQPPTNIQLTGFWYGTKLTTKPKLRPVTLSLAPNGDGFIRRDDGTGRVTRNDLRWLLRGPCLHLSIDEGDSIAEISVCPTLSADKFNLTLSHEVKGLTSFRRDPMTMSGSD